MKKKQMTIVFGIGFICTMLICMTLLFRDVHAGQTVDALQIGKICVSQIYPDIKWETEEEKPNNGQMTAEKTAPEQKEPEPVDNSKPRVIIYHTHSSESYQPYSESNFHREEETGTVREVGNVMTAELNRLGIAVVHDTTIHDRPSYNQSYDRSLETITALLRQYPTAEVVIDLHRDAAAYTGNTGPTVTVNGETAAKYKFVIGQNNENYGQLYAFAEKVNAKAESMYPGFTGQILEKTYRYNEYIADQYLLLEVGNNQNSIEHAKTTGKYFAGILAAVLEE